MGLSSPSLMVDCPSCGARAGYDCRFIYVYVGEKVPRPCLPHAARQYSYIEWKKALGNNGFIKRSRTSLVS